MKFSGKFILRLYIILSFQIITASAFGHNIGTQLFNDTSKSSDDTIHLIATTNSSSRLQNMMDDSIENELLDSGNVYLKNNINEDALVHFIGSDKIKKDFHDKKIIKKIYGKLAKIFVKKKYYPIAMQYYYEAFLDNGWQDNYIDTDKIIGTVFNTFDLTGEHTANRALADTGGNPAAVFLSDSFQQSYLNNRKIFFASRKGIENNSDPVKGQSITEDFEDGKNAVAYAIIIHVKQPKAGRRKAFTGINNVGHTFITLLKYNSDSTCISHSFGFYPQKDNFLSATPLHPASSSVFKDDAVHDWDEAVGKFISERRFKKLIKLVGKFDEKKYDLNGNNCTDFGLYAADVAGISINNTKGNWPLGRGNNPANAGQSILEGKFLNTDTGNSQGLFICADVK
jgi:hypothetical protein